MRDYLKLARIGNAIITFISIECAGILCGVNIAQNWKIFAAAIAAALITAGGNAINDLFDMDIDRINRPNRPLASGKLTVGNALAFYFVVTSAGLIVSAAINAYALSIAAVASVSVLLYSYRLKRSVFFGNFTVALMTGLAFIYGGASVNDFKDVYPAAVFAFLTNLIREIIKDAEDVKGDGEIGVRTIATKYGTNTSAYLSIFLTVILLIMVYGSFGLRILPTQFLAVCGLTIFPIGIYITYLL
ncbi:MAG: geranylgeranylglycerol-phosphate geranylgeranyltransferase, partial [Candidatus Kryptoniota bacterium]